MRHFILIVVLSCCFAVHASEIKLDSKTTVSFATVEIAKKILGSKDNFIRELSEFDRAARLKTNRVVSEKEFLAFAAANALPWRPEERARVRKEIGKIRLKLAEFKLNLPESILLVKTTCKEEGRAAYTRGNAVILPRNILDAKNDIHNLIAHEIFHVFTRYNPKVREALYESIGFFPCNEIEFPKKLKSRKITNPDAPKNKHYIIVKYSGKAVSVVPILFLRTQKYDPKKGGEFFNYLTLKLLVIRKYKGKWEAKYSDGKPILIDMEQVTGFYDQVGQNTSYIIYPEEIVAENFELLVIGKQNLPAPLISETIRNILIPQKKTTPKKKANSDKPDSASDLPRSISFHLNPDFEYDPQGDSEIMK